MKRIDLPIEEIGKKHKNGISMAKLAREYGVSCSVILDRLLRYYIDNGIERPDRNGRPPIEVPIKEIIEKYQKGSRVEDLAKEYQVTMPTLYRKLNEYYRKEERNKTLKKGRKAIELPIEEIVKEYENGTRVEDLAKEYEVTTTTIRRRVREYYREEERIIKRGLKIPQIIEKYENGTSVENIAKEYETTCYIINNIIGKYYETKGMQTPRILKSVKIIEAYLKKGISIEEITRMASSQNIIIPKDIINEVSKSISVSTSVSHYEKESRVEDLASEVDKRGLYISEIVEKYENGTSAESIAKEYETTYYIISKIIKKYYEEKGMRTPRILKSIKVLEEYLGKGMTIEEITRMASSQNVIIPKNIIDKALKNVDISHNEER